MSPQDLVLLTRRNRPGVETEHGMYVTVEYLLWRDQLRRWKWAMDSYGTYAQVEDK
jgi:hypothetical protein